MDARGGIFLVRCGLAVASLFLACLDAWPGAAGDVAARGHGLGPFARMTTTHDTKFSLDPQPLGVGPTLASMAEVIAYLRAELDASAEPARRALVGNELAAALAQEGDETGAARAYLASFGTAPDFREPLEGLVALIGRRRSVKSLGKLLESLERAALTPEETSRALVEQAAFAIEHDGDAAAARMALARAAVETPDDLSVWLEREVLAGREGADDDRRKALEERAQRAEPPAWRALLLLGLADLYARAGNPARALAVALDAAALEGETRFLAVRDVVERARQAGDDDALADALTSYAVLIESVLSDPAAARAAGVPTHARLPAVAADAFVRAAQARHRAGEIDRAASLLDRALEIAPGEGALINARLAIADTLGDATGAARLAAALLERGARGADAASLRLRLAEDAAGRGDLAGAFEALAAAVEADPGCVPARALQLDLLAMSNTPEHTRALATSLTALADQLGESVSRARSHFAAAWELATGARDARGAAAAVAQAKESGASALLTARVSRTLAALCVDREWYEEATAQLLAAPAPASEHAGLWFELGRARLLRGEVAEAREAWARLAAAPQGAWLGRIMDAYGSFLPLRGVSEVARGGGAEALDALAQLERDPALASGLAVAAVRRAHLAGEREGAKARLRALLAANPRDMLAPAYLAQLLRAEGDMQGAADALSAMAAEAPEAQLGASLYIEGAFLLWAAGKRPAACALLHRAYSLAPEAAAGPLFWAQNEGGQSPSDAGQRVIETEILAGKIDVRAHQALAQFALEAAKSGRSEQARAALFELEQSAVGELRVAAALARLAWPVGNSDALAVDQALAVLDETDPLLAAAERVRIARERGMHAASYVDAAAKWAQTQPTVATAIEWLSAAMAAGATGAEASAHELLASFLLEPGSSAEAVASACSAWLTSPATLHGPVPGVAPATRLFNLELAPPGCDPRRRSAALRGLGDTLGNDAQLDALALAGWSDLVRGSAQEALHAFERVVSMRPDDLAAWEGVRAAAERAGELPSLARASQELGARCSDDAQGAAFWEAAGAIWLHALGDEDAAEHAFARALARDPRRTFAFDKVFRRLRARGDDNALLALVTQRLAVADDSEEIAKLYWERARVLRKQGDPVSALDALQSVTLLEPDHVGALALSGEIYIKRGSYAEAAAMLSRLASLASAPTQQRLVSGIAAVDLFENRLGQPALALDVLLTLRNANLSTLPVRERLAVVAAKTGSWVQAASTLEELMYERETPAGRVAAARLAMAIWRDKAGEPENARRAVVKLLEEEPGDPEALGYLLNNDFDAPLKSRALAAGYTHLVQRVQQSEQLTSPDARARIELLAGIARVLGDASLMQAALGALVAVGGGDMRAAVGALEALDQRASKVPQIQIDERLATLINDPYDRGPLVALFSALGPTLGAALGPSKEALGVGRKERVEPRTGLPLRNDVASWAGAFGLGEFELYVGGNDPHGVHGVAGDAPALVVGANVASPLSASGRQAIARELFALRRGTTILKSRNDATVAAVVVAACNLAGVRLAGPTYAMLSDVQRQLDRHLPRRIRKLLPELCAPLVASGADPRAWVMAAARSLDRIAAIAVGDASLVLADVLGVTRANVALHIDGNERAASLLRFVLSPAYIELRRSLGMGVR